MAGDVDIEIISLEVGGIYPGLGLLVKSGAGINPQGVHVGLLGIGQRPGRQKQRHGNGG